MDEILYKEAKNTVQALIKDKKRKVLQDKLSENIGKPKELWKIIKKCVYQTKRLPQEAYASIQKWVDISPRTIANTFKKKFASLANDLVKTLPDPTRKFGIPSVRQYYKVINF